MGSYATLYFSNFEIEYFKSYVDPIIMTIFRESDRRQTKWIDDNEERVSFQYCNSVRTIKLRLDVMGFSLDNTIKEFYRWNSDVSEYIYEIIEDEDFLLFDDYTFENWLKLMKYIVTSNQYYFELIDKIKPHENPLLYYILSEQNEGNSLYGFKSSDARYVFRALLELFDDEDKVILDYSDLVDGGYYSEEEKICESSLQSMADTYVRNERIIIISEGSSDIAVIKRTMDCLFPDIVDYYSFMDFEQSNASGSANSLVSYVKAFIGSGLRNRIIALFDNDTAAEEAILALNKVNVPPNIKVLRYPYLEMAINYPTIGPTGIEFTDINGLACSIELYLGSDILTNNDEPEFRKPMISRIGFEPSGT
jgi:hypothetical protein